MSEDPRDTQFLGFARALVDELMKVQSYDNTLQSEKIIAQRAYDLVDHTVSWIDPMDFECQTEPYEAILKSIPDLTEFPSE